MTPRLAFMKSTSGKSISAYVGLSIRRQGGDISVFVLVTTDMTKSNSGVEEAKKAFDF